MCAETRQAGGVGTLENKLIREFITRLSKSVDLESLVLFGSRARGEHLDSSDVDVVVVSPSFQGLSVDARLNLVQNAWPGGKALESVPITPEELKDMKKLVICDALEEGIVLLDRGTWARTKHGFGELKSAGEIKKAKTGWQFSEAEQSPTH